MLKYIVFGLSLTAMAQTPNVIPLTPDETAQWKQSEKWVQEDQNKLAKDQTDQANLKSGINRAHKLSGYYDILDDKYLVYKATPTLNGPNGYWSTTPYITGPYNNSSPNGINW